MSNGTGATLPGDNPVSTCGQHADNGTDEVSTHTDDENANGGNVSGMGGNVDVEHDTGDGAVIEGDTVQHNPETTATAGDPVPAPAHPGMMNLRQFRDPAGHAAKLAERNRENPPRLTHGLRSRFASETSFTILCRPEMCIGNYETCSDNGGATCTALPAIKDDYVKSIIEAAGWLRDTDSILIEMLGAQLTIRDYIKYMINSNGGLALAVCKKGGLGARLYVHFKECEKRIISLCDSLALNPAARARLGLNIAEFVRRQSVDLSGYTTKELEKMRDNLEWDKKLQKGGEKNES